jgi:hypothetical protein
MRTMKLNDSEVEVIEWVLLSNGWEVYVIEYEEENGRAFTFTCGMADEFGYQSIDDLKEYAIARTVNLEEIMPPPRWSWAECDVIE